MLLEKLLKILNFRFNSNPLKAKTKNFLNVESIPAQGYRSNYENSFLL